MLPALAMSVKDAVMMTTRVTTLRFMVRDVETCEARIHACER